MIVMWKLVVIDVNLSIVGIDVVIVCVLLLYDLVYGLSGMVELLLFIVKLFNMYVLLIVRLLMVSELGI